MRNALGRISFFIGLTVMAMTVPAQLRFTTDLNRSGVEAPAYTLELQHDLTTADTVARVTPAGEPDSWAIEAFSIISNGTRYTFDFQRDPPDAYPIATGPIFNELHLVNIVLRDDAGQAWPGLAVLSFYALPDRVYATVRFVTYRDDNPDPAIDNVIIHNDDGQATDNFIYDARPGFGNFAGPSNVTQMQFVLRCAAPFPAVQPAAAGSVQVSEGHMGLIATTPGLTGVFSSAPSTTDTLDLTYSFNESWTADTNHEFGLMFAPGDDLPAIDAAMANHRNNAALAVDSSGQANHWSPLRGVWEVNSPIAINGKGVIKSTKITLTNNAAEAVPVVIDHRNTYGGFAASETRDPATGLPIPRTVQNYVNYPENGSIGEKGGGRIYNTMIVPAGGVFAYNFQTLYNGSAGQTASGNYVDWVQRDTLGHKPNLTPITHFTINRQEMLTIRHDAFNFTDWRKHVDNLREEFDVRDSASAAATQLLALTLASGEPFRLQTTRVEASDVTPFFIEEIYRMESVPAGVSGTVRVWTASWNDESIGATPVGEGNARFGVEVDLHVDRDLALDPAVSSPVSFISVDRGNPGYFKKFGYSSLAQGTHVINIAPEVHRGPEPVPDAFFMGFFNADNGINRTRASDGTKFLIPFSDVTGNPFIAVWDWDVKLNGAAIAPALQLDALPPGAVDRSYRVVPPAAPATVQAGSTIAFKMMAVAGGDNSSTVGYGEKNFNTWKDIQVVARVGQELSEFPPKVQADANGNAEFTVTGGTEWLPVVVVGIDPDLAALVVESGPDLDHLQTMTAPVAGEPYYQVRNDAQGRTVLTIPVSTSGDTLPLTRVVRVTSGNTALPRPSWEIFYQHSSSRISPPRTLRTPSNSEQRQF